MANIPQDILIDVLSRLPAKTVGRFRSVCKSWRSLISKPEFVKTHLNRAITDVSVGCQRVVLIPNNCSLKSRRSQLQSIDYEALHLLSDKKLEAALQNNGGNACTLLDFPAPEHRVYIVGSCHGMVGMVVDMDKIVICNPCTREFRELPKPTSSIPSEYMISGGLGYDSSMDDYKFVIAAVVKAEVFSLRSNSWRMLHNIGANISSFFGVNGSGVFLNGALHWIASRRAVQMIISFDMATEKFQELFPVPPNPGYNYPRDYIYSGLVVLGGYLSVSCRFSGKIQVWVMKEYGVEASWTKLFTLDLQVNEDYYSYYLRPLCFSKNGELLVNLDGQIRIYNLTKKKSPIKKKNKSRKLYEGSWRLRQIVAFTESLVSPNGNVENKEHNFKQ